MTENISYKKKTSLHNQTLEFVFLLADTKLTQEGSRSLSAALSSQHPHR